MAAKYAWQVEQGMKLEPVDMYSGNQIVESVYLVDGVIQIQTDQTTWVFKHNELVKFPRRPDGDTYLWGVGGEKVNIGKICIGDIVPPKEGWVDSDGNITDPNEVRATGYVVSSLTYSSMGRVFTLRRIGSSELASNTIDVLVVWEVEYLYDHGTVFTIPEEKVINRSTGANSSGFYLNREEGRRVRFRVEGSRGRPPKESELPPKTAQEWAQWTLLEGQEKHPRDPR